MDVLTYGVVDRVSCQHMEQGLLSKKRTAIAIP